MYNFLTTPCFGPTTVIFTFKDYYLILKIGSVAPQVRQNNAIEYGDLVQPNSLVSLALKSRLGISMLLSANFGLN